MFLKKGFNRLMALLVFAISLVTYLRTIAPTTSFWDCGEFITCSYILGVPHPPGAPLYLLIGRIFSMIPFAEDIGLRVNLISAITSALTVMLGYLIIVRFITLWRGAPKSTEDHFILYASGIIGSLAFAFTYTFWFNAVEAEVYAISMFFTAIVVWLALVWYEKADEPGSSRYLLMIMFCVGLAIGIHLLNILALPAIALVIYFRKFKQRSGSEFASPMIFGPIFGNIPILGALAEFVGGVILGAISFGVALLMFKIIVFDALFHIIGTIIPGSEQILLFFVRLLFPSLRSIGEAGFGTALVFMFPIYVFLHVLLHKQSEELRFYTEGALLVSLTSFLMVAIYPGIVKGIPWILNTTSPAIFVPFLIIIVSSTIIFSAFWNTIITSIGQLKGDKNFETVSFKLIAMGIMTLIFVIIDIAAMYRLLINGSQVWHTYSIIDTKIDAIAVGIIMIAVGVSLGFGLAVLLRNQITKLVLIGSLVVLVGTSSYLMIYIRSGLNPAIDENNPEDTKKMVSYLNRDQYGEWSITDRHRWKSESPFEYSGQFDYLWRYQIKRMYLRYFAWQFMGKGTTYDKDNYIKETFSPNGLYYLPFLLGLIGFIYHFYKDWRMSLSVLTLFIMTGIAIVIYLNQEDPQPRERDYVYVASFFAFALWIGIGVTAILEWLSKEFRRNPGTKLILQSIAILLILLAVPLNLYSFNREVSDRTGNYVAFDYSYNILQSCEKDAILFTNGDNDTFPLWFLQYVYGIRKDVRVVNLSLLNTDWYIYQLRDEEPKVPISLADKQIDNIMPRLWPIPGRTDTVYFDVPRDAFDKELPDVEFMQLFPSDSITSKKIGIKVAPTLRSQHGSGLRVQDLMIIDIITTNRWKKPIYFAVTVSTKNQLNLRKYLRMDGLSFKLVPSLAAGENISPERLERNLNEIFQYRGLNDPTVYFNENIMGLLTNYRAGYLRLAEYYRKYGNKEKMLAALDSMQKRIPEEIIPIDDLRVFIPVGQLYHEGGRSEEYLRRIKVKMESGELSPELLVSIAYRHVQEKELNVASKIVEMILQSDSTQKQAKMLDQLIKMDQAKQQSKADTAKKVVSEADTSQ
ncbi:DUF2723 domain-containing protein [candidate division KSB1 bacterium]|nr:DUF2723 domain-containing protein [candidate division KSB1 bacterium]